MATLTSDTRPIIGRGPSLAARFLLLAGISIGLMVADHRHHYLNQMRTTMLAAAYPIQWLVDSPFRVFGWITGNFSDRARLRTENARLTTELRDANIQLQRLAALSEENRRLRALREASGGVAERNLIAEIMRVDLDPLRHRVLLNKGNRDGIYKGQAVLDAQGIFGQITQVGAYSSQAVLITDTSHAIPVRVNRNGLRTIAEGTGNLNKLNLPFLTGEADIKVGDLLVSSGLGGIFPPGYPVAKVSRVERNPAETFATVEAQPLAKLDRDQEVLLIWYQEQTIDLELGKKATPKGEAKAATPAKPTVSAPMMSAPSPTSTSAPAVSKPPVNPTTHPGTAAPAAPRAGAVGPRSTIPAPAAKPPAAKPPVLSSPTASPPAVSSPAVPSSPAASPPATSPPATSPQTPPSEAEAQ